MIAINWNCFACEKNRPFGAKSWAEVQFGTQSVWDDHLSPEVGFRVHEGDIRERGLNGD